MTQAPGCSLACGRRPGCHEAPWKAAGSPTWAPHERPTTLWRPRADRFRPLGPRAHPRPAGPLGLEASRLYLRRLAVQSLDGRPLDVETLGARMRLYPHNNVCEKRILFTPQFFDPQERAILESRIGERFSFVDIGANVGAYALFVAARAGATGRILAVEPQPEIFDRLAYNIRLNPFGTVKAVACAVADKAGELTFLDPGNKGESSVKIVSSSQTGAVRVPAVPLLDLLNQEGFTCGRRQARRRGRGGPDPGPLLPRRPAKLHPSLLIIEDGRDQWQMDLSALLERKGYRLVAQTRLNLSTSESERARRLALRFGGSSSRSSPGRHDRHGPVDGDLLRRDPADIGVGLHARREGVAKSTVVGGIDVAGDVEAVGPHLDHVDEGRAGPAATMSASS